MNETVTFFSDFKINDLMFLGEAAVQTLIIAVISISSGTLMGSVFGWVIAEGKAVLRWPLNSILDVFRSVPLIIQLILFYNLFPIIGFDLTPFSSGVIVLTFYTAALVSSVVRGGIESVGPSMRRASRSLGMSYWQSIQHVIMPIGLRAVLPAWIGVALGVLKDSALVSVLGHVELLRASQILITRTQEPFLILTLGGLFYFALSYPLSLYSKKLEQRWAS